MRRLARRLLTVASAASLLLFVAVCVLWVRSYWYADQYFSSERKASGLEWTYSETEFVSVEGVVGGGMLRRRAVVTQEQIDRWLADRSDDSLGGGWDTFHAGSDVTRGPGSGFTLKWANGTAPEPLGYRFQVRSASAPYWSLAVACGLFPSLWAMLTVRHRRRAARLAANRCPTCGYDLRATPDRCPECGTEVPSAPPA